MNNYTCTDVHLTTITHVNLNLAATNKQNWRLATEEKLRSQTDKPWWQGPTLVILFLLSPSPLSFPHFLSHISSLTWYESRRRITTLDWNSTQPNPGKMREGWHTYEVWRKGERKQPNKGGGGGGPSLYGEVEYVENNWITIQTSWFNLKILKMFMDR